MVVCPLLSVVVNVAVGHVSGGGVVCCCGPSLYFVVVIVVYIIVQCGGMSLSFCCCLLLLLLQVMLAVVASCQWTSLECRRVGGVRRVRESRGRAVRGVFPLKSAGEN